MKILILNWRDIKHPKAGGAELVTQQMAKHWVKWGHEVHLFTAAFPNSLPEEVIDGVKIIRRGGQVSVRFHAWRYYQKHFKSKVDIVIDEINTLPFFTPLFVKEKKVVYFNQLAREVWFFETIFPFSILGYLLEPIYLQLYRRIPALAISQSTRDDLVHLGIKQVGVFPMAIDFDSEQKYLMQKEKNLTIIFVGRMVKSKRPGEVIKAVALLKKQIPDVCLWLVGGGEKRYVQQLKNLAGDLGVAENVQFKGYVTQDEKFTLMARAHLIAVTSIREGWGLIITEAAALKTPAVVYNVSGLRDAVKDKETGLIINSKAEELAAAIALLNEDQILYSKLQQAAYNWSQEMTWDSTARKSFAFIQAVFDGKSYG